MNTHGAANETAELVAKLEALQLKMTRLAELVDLRIRPLEEDARLVKQHLLRRSAHA